MPASGETASRRGGGARVLQCLTAETNEIGYDRPAGMADGRQEGALESVFTKYFRLKKKGDLRLSTLTHLDGKKVQEGTNGGRAASKKKRLKRGTYNSPESKKISKPECH